MKVIQLDKRHLRIITCHDTITTTRPRPCATKPVSKIQLQEWTLPSPPAHDSPRVGPLAPPPTPRRPEPKQYSFCAHRYCHHPPETVTGRPAPWPSGWVPDLSLSPTFPTSPSRLVPNSPSNRLPAFPPSQLMLGNTAGFDSQLRLRQAPPRMLSVEQQTQTTRTRR